MKKRKISFSTQLLTPALAAALLLSACHSADTNPSTPVGTDSSAMAATEGATDQTHVAPLDTSNSHIAAGTDSMTKPASTDTAAAKKKGRKGKVSIVTSEPKTGGSTNMEMDKEGFYSSTEVLPEFPGGQKALESFFENNIQYPEMASENGVEGTVQLSFNVDENGKVYQPMPKGAKIGSGLEEEAVRVFNKMPRWTPGKIKGKNVKTRFSLPIKFQLDQ